MTETLRDVIVEPYVEDPTGETMVINMGPQHPATHGVLRLILEIDGEVVLSVRPDVGYLHRGKEKLAEYKTYTQFIPYTDRMDYIAPMSNNLGYVLAVEKALGIEERITEKCHYLRMALAELSRISSHLMAVGAFAMDVGAMSAFLYAFREREAIYDIFERICGHRFTVSYMRAGGVSRDIPRGWLDTVAEFLRNLPPRVRDLEELLLDNEIFILRTKGLGIISPEMAINYSLSGPNLRGSGVPWDIRKAEPYLRYNEVEFDVITRPEGDSFARFIVRLEEIKQSARIVEQCIERLRPLEDQPVNIDDPKIIYAPKKLGHRSMEDLIHRFLLASEGYRVPPGHVYVTIEAPKGELGFGIVADGSGKPYRCRVRSPSFTVLQALDHMCRGYLVADVIAILGSIDIVLGDVDR